MTNLAQTPLYSRHVALGARMVPFAGYSMPVQYASILKEHEAVRTRAGLFDVSHMGEVVVRGPQAFAAVQELLSNDLARVPEGSGAVYAVMCHPNGTIVDDVIAYRVKPDEVFICVNAANRAKDFAHIKDVVARFDAVATDESDRWAQLALQGPKAVDVVRKLNAQAAGLEAFRWLDGKLLGKPARISRTGYTGEDGFELYVASEHAGELMDALLAGGEVTPCGLGARDSLRLEVKYPLYGHDISDETTPLEAGLAWVVKLEKPSFVGREALVQQKQRGVQRKLVGLQLDEKSVPREGYEVLSAGGERLGVVTSGTLSPTLGIPIALAYVPVAHAAVGTEIAIAIRQKRIPGRVVKTPFYARGGA